MLTKKPSSRPSIHCCTSAAHTCYCFCFVRSTPRRFGKTFSCVEPRTNLSILFLKICHFCAQNRHLRGLSRALLQARIGGIQVKSMSMRNFIRLAKRCLSGLAYVRWQSRSSRQSKVAGEDDRGAVPIDPIAPSFPLLPPLLPFSLQFVRLLGHEPIEYNQEQARIKAYDGGESLIRSFP